MSHPPPTYGIITTPPLRRSFPLPCPSRNYFTGDLFDRLVLFLHKNSINFTHIECVSRGTDKSTAMRDGPTLCISIVKGTWPEKEVKEVVAVKEEHVNDMLITGKTSNNENEREKEKAVSELEKDWLEAVGEASEKHMQGKQQEVEKPQPEEEQVSRYIEEVAELFKNSQFALELPPEIMFVEFVGVILDEDPGRIAHSGHWMGRSVKDLLTGN